MPVSAEMAFASIRTLGKKLRENEFSAVELADFFLNRLENIGPKLNAVVRVTRDLAMRQAAEADKELARGIDRGPLHGIPYGAKDLLATRDIPTSWGAAPLKEQVFDKDATAILKMKSAGAVLVAKLAMVEIAGGLGYNQANASFTGPGLNPWDVNAWSGGSSSGPGSAVGGGLVPMAIGSETWGSIMVPASYCGVSGLRPTYGRISRHGAMALSWTMDKLGPMCRTADDCGLMLNALAGRDKADPTSSRRPYEYPPQPALQPPFRLGVLRGCTQGVQKQVRENFEKSVKVLSQYATVEDMDLPDMPYGVVSATFVSCEMAAAFEGLVTSGDVWEMTAPEDRIGAHAALMIPAKDYINAMRIRPFIQQALDDILAQYDAVISPTLPAVANPLNVSFGEYHRRHRGNSLGGAGNAAGVPAISIPNGFGERDLPTGLQLVGRAFEENRLLAIAKLYQEKTTWHEKTPKPLS